MTPLALTAVLLSTSPHQTSPAEQTPPAEVWVKDAESPAPRVPPPLDTPAARPFEFGVQFGGLRILDNPLASSSLYLGGRASYRLPYSIVPGVVGQYDDFSSRTSTGSDFSYWATRAELGYELSQSGSLSVLPYAQVGYASSETLRCMDDVCARSFGHGSVGALGLRFAALGDWYLSGFEINYQFGHVHTLFFGMSGGFRL